MQTKFLPLSVVKVNDKNPRSITEVKFKKLVNSLLALPKMLEIRPIAIDRDNIVLGGNMRLRALQSIAAMPFEDIKNRLDTSRDVRKKTPKERQTLEAYWRDWLANPLVPTVDVSTLTKPEQKEFVIKDNGDFGQWDYDMLANEWDNDLLDEWGVNMPIMETDINVDDFFDALDYAEAKADIKSLIEDALSGEYSECKVK